MQKSTFLEVPENPGNFLSLSIFRFLLFKNSSNCSLIGSIIGLEANIFVWLLISMILLNIGSIIGLKDDVLGSLSRSAEKFITM
jgi:hypothetical protein